MGVDRNRRALLLAAATLAAGAAGPAAALSLGRTRKPAFPDIPYATWSDDEPGYRLYPGDEIEVATPTAPELTRTVRVAPDGRVELPLIGSVMAADRELPELRLELTRAYAAQLVRPVVEVSLKQAAPLKVFVGGEVGAPGVFEINGDVDALQAVIMAGGFKPSARRDQVVLLRRGAGGRAMMRTVDLAKALKGVRGAERAPLRRFDIVFVPRSGIAEVGAFMGQIRDALPIGFSYSLNSPYR
jgi:polysaccharide export outer membrane protein